MRPHERVARVLTPTTRGCATTRAASAEWSLARLSLGLGVAGMLYVVAMVFDGLLQHRLASWKYFYATASDALSGGQPLD